MKKILLLSLVALFALSCAEQKAKKQTITRKTADQICQTNLILDSHIDWPELQRMDPVDIPGLNERGDFDYERAKKGGLNAVLSVSWIPPRLNASEGRTLHDSQVEMISSYAEDYPDKFALAKTPAEVEENFKNGLLSIPICLENGSPIGNDLSYIKHLKEQGMVYITLCHMTANQISDANFDPNHKWKGLSPFGKEVVKEMNRQGIIVDISHSTDDAAYQALEVSEAPIIASHSSCRYFTPGLDRNLPDSLIKAIASKGGVIMLNFASYQLNEECMKNWNYLFNTWSDSTGISLYSDKGAAFLEEFGKTHQLQATVSDLVDHIDHIVEIAGIDYIGIGSDFDGLNEESLPSDLGDVTTYPLIVKELLARNYNEEDIKKILSGNFLRVWQKVLDLGTEE